MGISLDAANALEEAIDRKIAAAASRETRAVGTVTRVDADGQAYVMLDGSGVETPATSTTAAVREGERVVANVANGELTIDGNTSAPATDDTQANKAMDVADSALDSAAQAASAAASAVENAAIAEQAAQDAQDSADAAARHLSEVENVVGTLDWIAEHGEYSNDLDYFDQSAIYYISSASSPTGFAIVTEPTESGMWSYSLTQDEHVDQSKTYYEQIDSATYEPVENPTDEGLPNYYERTSVYYVLDIQESVQNYIATHLALTDEGLHIFGDSTDYSALLSPLGLEIRKPGGTSVALYGEDFRIGTTDKVHLLGTSTKLAFHTAAGDIAYFGKGDDDIWRMVIEEASVTNMIRFGNYAWVKRANGNMTMKYLED